MKTLLSWPIISQIPHLQIASHSESCFNIRIFSSVQFSRLVVSDSMLPHGHQHARLPCPSPTPGACSNSCPSSWWCYPTMSSSVVPYPTHLQSFLASGSFPRVSSSHQVAKVLEYSASVSVLPKNIQDLSPLGLTRWISLQSKGLSRAFYKTTVQKHQCFSAQLSL